MKLKDFDELCMLCSSPRWLERCFEIDFMSKDLAPLRRALFVDFCPELVQRWSPRWLERRFAIDFVPEGLATLAYCFELALVELEDFGAPLVPRWPALLCASGRCTGLSGGLHYMSCFVTWSSWTSASCAAHAALVPAIAGAPIRDRLHAAAAG